MAGSFRIVSSVVLQSFMAEESYAVADPRRGGAALREVRGCDGRKTCRRGREVALPVVGDGQ